MIFAIIVCLFVLFCLFQSWFSVEILFYFLFVDKIYLEMDELNGFFAIKKKNKKSDKIVVREGFSA